MVGIILLWIGYIDAVVALILRPVVVVVGVVGTGGTYAAIVRRLWERNGRFRLIAAPRDQGQGSQNENETRHGSPGSYIRTNPTHIEPSRIAQGKVGLMVLTGPPRLR